MRADLDLLCISVYFGPAWLHPIEDTHRAVGAMAPQLHKLIAIDEAERTLVYETYEISVPLLTPRSRRNELRRLGLGSATAAVERPEGRPPSGLPAVAELPLRGTGRAPHDATRHSRHDSGRIRPTSAQTSENFGADGGSCSYVSTDGSISSTNPALH